MQSRLYRAPWHDGGLLLPGEIDERHAFARELVVLYIADDSDNLSRLGLLGPVSFVTQPKLLADGVLMGKVTAGGGRGSGGGTGGDRGGREVQSQPTARRERDGRRGRGRDGAVAAV